MSNFKGIVYLSEEQFTELRTNGTLTVGEETVIYDENTVYAVPEVKETPDTTLSVSGKAADAAAVGEKIAEVDTEITDHLLEKIYPVGSIYMSVNNLSPENFLGGTWERIEDRFLLAAGATYGVGSEGGSADAVVVTHRHNNIAWEDGGQVIKSTLTSEGNSSEGTGATGVELKYNSAHGTTWSIYTEYTGESGAGKNMPPYLAVYMWKRIS